MAMGRFTVGLLMAVLALGAGADGGQQGPLDPRAVSFKEATTYWTGSVIASTLTSLILVYMIRKYIVDPVYQEPTVRVFIPVMFGNAFLSWGYCIHHSYNLANGGKAYYGSGIENTGFTCSVTVAASLGLVIQMYGFPLVAWAPLHMIRRAKEFKPVVISNRLLAGMVGCGTVAFFLAVTVGNLLTGQWLWTQQYRQLYCAAPMLGSWLRLLPFMAFVNTPLGAAGYFYLAAQKELKNLGKTASAVNLQAEARTVRNYGILSIMNSLFWNGPAFTVILLDTAGVDLPVAFILIAGWLIKYNALGDFVIITMHVRGIKEKQKRRQARSLRSTFREGVGKGLDTKQLANRGISIHYLYDFVERHGIDASWTIGDVMTKIVKPETDERKCPFVDTIANLVDEEGRPAMDRPPVFVSHCWADGFLTLLEQLTSYYYTQGTMGTLYFWIDIFCINQHDVGAATELPVMHTVIETSEAVVLTLNPWSAPKTLTRVWCLWELLKAVEYNTQIRPVMPDSEEEDFMKTIQVDHSKISQVFENIDVANASATHEKDKAMIFGMITETVGFDGLNNMVKDRLQLCLQGVAVDRTITGTSSMKGALTDTDAKSTPSGKPQDEQV